MTATIPAARRAEGLGYWGLAAVLAVGIAPALGFWVYRHGWAALCLEIAGLNVLMAFIAWRLPDDRALAPSRQNASEKPIRRAGIIQSHVEWRVVLLSTGLALVTFGYGALTSFSALFADALSITPRSEFLTVMAVAVLAVRLTIGRRLDALGHRRALVWGFVPPAAGLALLSLAEGRMLFFTAAAIFGVGFGIVHPAYTAYMLAHVDPARRGAAFGAMLTAFDTGIGTGASLTGWLVDRFGFRVAFAAAAFLAALALPVFVVTERRLHLDRTVPPVHSP
jgi:predicted MFS family arabinose efflux permease